MSGTDPKLQKCNNCTENYHGGIEFHMDVKAYLTP